MRNALVPPFREAVRLLAEHGNPITQLRVMRACQDVQDIDFIEALRKPLNSPVNWLRSQALILIGSSRASARAIGSDLATEIAFDLANGFFPKRFGACWKAAKSGGRGALWSLLSASVVWIANLLLLIVTAAALYYSLSKVGNASVGLPSLLVLSQKSSFLIAGFAVTALATLALKNSPQLMWMALLGGAAGSGAVIAVCPALWSGDWSGFGILLLTLVLGGWAVIWGPMTVAASAYHLGALIVFLGLTTRTRARREPVRTFVRAAMKNGLYDWGLTRGLAVGAVHCGLWPLGWWLDAWQKWTLHPFIAAVAGLYFGILIGAFAVLGVVLAVAAPLVFVRRLRKGGLALLWQDLQDLCAGLRFYVRGLKREQVAPALTWLSALSSFVAADGYARKLSGGPLQWIAECCAAGVGGWIGWLVYSAVVRKLAWALRISGLVMAAAAVVLLLALGLNKFVHNLVAASIAVVSVGWLTFAGIAWGPRVLHKALGVLLAVGATASLVVGIVLYWPSVPLMLARILVACALAAVVGMLFFGLRYLWRAVSAELFRVRRFPPGSFTPEAWKKLISNASADRQERLLARTDHQALSLTVPDYLAVLKEVRTMINAEPETALTGSTGTGSRKPCGRSGRAELTALAALPDYQHSRVGVLVGDDASATTLTTRDDRMTCAFGDHEGSAGPSPSSSFPLGGREVAQRVRVACYAFLLLPGMLASPFSVLGNGIR